MASFFPLILIVAILALFGKSSSSGFITSTTSRSQTPTPNALSVFAEAAQTNSTLNALSVLDIALTITLPLTTTTTTPVAAGISTLNALSVLESALTIDRTLTIDLPLTATTTTPVAAGLSTLNALSVLESALTIDRTLTIDLPSTTMTATPVATGLTKRDACTSFGIIFDCAPVATALPPAAVIQGCGKSYSSNTFASSGATIRSAAYDFCGKWFSGIRTLSSGDSIPTATINAADGKSITFEVKLDWLSVSPNSYFEMNRENCFANFASAINLCDSEAKPFMSGGHMDTEVNGVPVHFMITVLPGSSVFGRKIGKRDVAAFIGDTPNPINYITTTHTWIEAAQTVTEDAFDSYPATTYTLTGGTFTQTIYPTTVSGDAVPATTAS